MRENVAEKLTKKSMPLQSVRASSPLFPRALFLPGLVQLLHRLANHAEVEDEEHVEPEHLRRRFLTSEKKIGSQLPSAEYRDT